ncbi:MAG: hypothetical protein KGZ67_04645 [Hydrogenophaga sp.]|jgi:hypothetical protein|nr:hypothetical protein [Hydrogenophaga sp.]
MPNFAALEQRLNRVAVGHLSNASAVWYPGGWPGSQVVDPRSWYEYFFGPVVSGLRVVFDREAGPALDGLVNDTNPVLSVLESAARGARRGDVIEVTPDGTEAATRFEVVRATPDGTGLLVLHLMAEGSL